MSTSLLQWIKKNSVLLFNTGSLVGTMLVTSGLGFAYWWVAARFFPTESVGLASSATSIMMVLSTLFLLGQGTLLISELSRNKGQEGALISASLLLVGGSSLIGSILFAILVPLIFPALRFLGTNIATVLLFAFGVTLASVTVVLDQAAIGLLQGSLQLWRNTLFSIAKLALLVVVGNYLAQKSGISVYTTWTIGNLLSLIPILVFLISRKKWSPRYYIPNWDMMKNFGWASIQHHILNLIVQAPTQLLSPMVTILVSSQANGWFYIALMMANFVFSLSTSLTTVLHATNAAKATTLTQKTRMTIGLSLLASLSIGVVLYFGAVPILHFFGSTYANHATTSLRILIFASIPLTIKNHYLAICRIKDQVRQAIIPVTVGAVLELGLAAVGARMWGLDGLSMGWVGSLIVEALIMTPVVWSTMMGSSELDRYLDMIAASETMLLPALDQFQFQPTGAIQITSTGLASVLTELDTVRISAVKVKQLQDREAHAKVQKDNGSMKKLSSRDNPAPSFSGLLSWSSMEADAHQSSPSSLPVLKPVPATEHVNEERVSSANSWHGSEPSRSLQSQYRVEKPKAARSQTAGEILPGDGRSGTSAPGLAGVSQQFVERSNTARPQSFNGGPEMAQPVQTHEKPKADRTYRAEEQSPPVRRPREGTVPVEKAHVVRDSVAIDYNDVEQLDFSGRSIWSTGDRAPLETVIEEQETIVMPISDMPASQRKEALSKQLPGDRRGH